MQHYIGRENTRNLRSWARLLGRNCLALILASIVSSIVNAVFGLPVYDAIPGHLLLELPQPFWLVLDVFIGAGSGIIGGLLLGELQYNLFWHPRVPRHDWRLASALGGGLAWPLTYSLILHWIEPLDHNIFALGIGRYRTVIFVGILLLLGALGGAIMGGLQGVVIRQHNQSRFVWIMAMLLSGILVVGIFIIIITLLTLRLHGGGGTGD